eukprot:16433321-Heterocapsa_arctica.AAC.1
MIVVSKPSAHILGQVAAIASCGFVRLATKVAPRPGEQTKSCPLSRVGPRSTTVEGVRWVWIPLRVRVRSCPAARAAPPHS